VPQPNPAPALTSDVKPAPLERPAAPATTSNIDRKQATALLVQALMQRDQHRALEIIELGVDPNGRDQSGIPVLNWAVLMCQPPVVKALIDAKADSSTNGCRGCPSSPKLARARKPRGFCVRLVRGNYRS
jgi:ankyrin repeat protein